MNRCFRYRINIMKCIVPYTYRLKSYIVITLLLGVTVLVADSILPIIYGVFIDRVILGGRWDIFHYVAIGYMLIWGITTLLGYVNCVVKFNFGNEFLLRIKGQVLDHYFHLPHDQYCSLDVGEAKNRIEDDSGHIQNFVDSQIAGLFVHYITLIICATLLFITEWRLACYSMIVIPIVIIIDKTLSKREKILNEENRVNDSKMANWLQESMKGWREIKALCLGKRQERIYNNYLKIYAIYYGKWINYWTARVLMIPQIRDGLLTKFGLYFFGGLLIINNNLHIKELLIFALYFEKLSAAIKGISNCDSELISNMPHTNRVVEHLKKNCFVKSYRWVNFDVDEIRLNNVDYQYPGTYSAVIKNISLTIKKGDRIAIVGKSGSGKSTLVKVIAGLIYPSGGTVQYNGINQCDIDIDSLHQRIGLIMQENVLFNTSIRENLRYGKEDALEEEMREACKKAYIWDDIEKLSEGLDTIIGERGLNFSAGQRQRLVLARLFLRSPDVYIFDEATSNLDPYSENFIHDALRGIDHSKIVLLISHRESAWNLCDKVFSVETGCFV